MKKMNKVLWLVLIISLVLSVALIWAGGQQESASSGAATDEEGFDWRRYEGTRLVVNFPPNLAYNKVVEMLPEFEALTGMKVEADMINYMRLHDKQVLEFSKPTGDYDVVSFVCMWKTEYVAGDNLEQLEPYFDNENLAMPDYDFDDLVPAFVDNTGRVGGTKIYMGGPGSKLYGVPLSAETSILAYRTDVYDELGLEYPKWYEEVHEHAKIIHEEVPGVDGLTMRGASGHQATAGWLTHGDPMGAKVFNEDWEPIFDNEDSIRTLNFMKDMVEWGPPGIPSFSVGDADNAFLQGKAALYIDHDKIAGLSRDESQSKVVGKVGYALHPKDKKYPDMEKWSETGGFGIGIPSNSANKEAAFLLLQWLTSKEVSEAVALAGGSSNRMSIFEDPEMQEKFPEFEVLVEQIKYADPDWRPIIKEWGEINVQYMGVAINQVLTGEKTPERAMDEIKEPVREIMQKAGYYD
jgi:multiple sugar transport system substrate-binding protein